MSENKATTFSGISFAEAKRIVEYEFSDCVIKIDRNNDGRNYEVHIVNKIEKEVVKKFKKYWQKRFIVKVYSFEYEV